MWQVAEWTKAISVKWRELTAEQKETFQKMAANDKQRYMQQVRELLQECRQLSVETCSRMWNSLAQTGCVSDYYLWIFQ